MEITMIGNYLNEPDKYLYGVCFGDDKKDVYENTYYNTIAEALSSIPSLAKESPVEVKIAICPPEIFDKNSLYHFSVINHVHIPINNPTSFTGVN